jgi:hypothetical protein
MRCKKQALRYSYLSLNSGYGGRHCKCHTESVYTNILKRVKTICNHSVYYYLLGSNAVYSGKSTDDSDEHTVSVFKVEEQSKQETRQGFLAA